MQIFKNAMWVYAHKISTALITLFSTPLILTNLGVEDYGIYTLTLGLVALFGFINWSLTTSTQRFIAVDLVNEKQDELKNTFTTSFFIHLAYGVFLLFLILTLGFFFTETILNIPDKKIVIAQNVLFFVAFISFFQMIGIPFQGLLKAYENLKVVSLLGVFDSLLKLSASFLLFYSPFNKLIFFSILTALSSLLGFLVLSFYCYKHYSIVSISWINISKSKFKDMMGFTSWNIIGAISILGRNQGIAIVLNLFFGVFANAAYGVALQVQAALGVFSQGIVQAMTPRILKSSGKQDSDIMINHAYLTAKYGIFVMTFVCLPLLINMNHILYIWLNELPVNAVIFSKLIIVFLLCTAFSIGIQTIFHGINKVKVYNIIISTILLLNIPIAAILFTFGFPAYFVFVVSISLEVISFFVRLYLLKKYVVFSPLNYLKKLSNEVLIPLITVFIIICTIANMIDEGTIQLIVTTFLSTFLLGMAIFFFSMTEDEKNGLKPLFSKIPFLK